MMDKTRTNHLIRRSTILLILAVSAGIGNGNCLSAQHVIENPGSPVAKNAGRVVVLSSSPPKILWLDQKGAVVKEFAYRSKIQGRIKLVGQTESEYLLSGSDSPFLNLPKNPAINDWIFHLFSLKEGEETIKDRGTFPVQAFIIPSGRGGGGIIPVNSFIAVPAGNGRILLSHTPEYLIKLYDPASNKVILQFRRSYERVKPDPNAAKKGGVNIGGKSYASAPVKYTADVTNLFVAGDRFWVVTSTMDPAKGVLIDVFDKSGRYLDYFFLKFPDGSLLKTLGLNQTAVLNGHVFAITLTEEDTYAVVKYRIDDPAAGETMK